MFYCNKILHRHILHAGLHSYGAFLLPQRHSIRLLFESSLSSSHLETVLFIMPLWQHVLTSTDHRLRSKTHVNMRVDDVGSADRTADLWKSDGETTVSPRFLRNIIHVNVALQFCAHSTGGVVSVWGCVTEENAHFVHRHRLDLLPSTHSHQQLVQLQFMGVAA